MPGSLIIGSYDVLAAGSPVTMAWDGGRDMGDPVPDVQTVARVLLDGDVVSGVRSANRTITLKLFIKRMSVADAAVIRAALFRTINQSQWTMQWTPDSGMTPVVFDCFRGQMERTWDEVRDSILDVLVLTIPALPFTRDAVATSLVPPAVPPTPTVIDAMEPGGPTAPAYMSEIANLSTTPEYDDRFQAIIPVPALATDFPQSTAVADAAQFAAGTQSRKITQQVITVGQFRDGAWQETTFAPLTTAGVLTNPVDLSGAGTVSWQARADAGSGSGGSVVLLQPTVVGIAPDAQDDSSLVPSIGDGTWALTLTDTSGRSATWLTQSRPTTAWATVSADLTQPPAFTQAGFDITAVAQYRLRLYRINASSLALVEGSTVELYGSDTGGTGVSLTGCTSASAVYTPEGGLYYGNAYVTVQASAGVTLAKWSHPVTVPVTAGSTYSASCGIFASSNNQAAAAGFAYSCGIEWLDVNGTVLSQSMGAAVAPVSYPAQTPTGGTAAPRLLALPVVAGVTAPASAVKARLRFVVDGGAVALADLFAAAAPRIVPGATVRRYRYANGIIERNSGNGGLPAPPGNVATSLWVDQLVANPATAGVTLSKSYGYALLPAVGGVARCPVSLAVAAQAQVNWLLLARTPNPPPRFAPVLDAPSSAGDTADATALRGAYQRSTAIFTLPAAAYSGTYAILGRVRPFLSVGSTVQVTVADGNSSTLLTATVVNPTAGAWQWVVFGAITLPPTGIAPQNSADTFTATFAKGAGTTGNADLDILVLVDLAGEMLIVDGAKLSSGVAPNRYWLDAPDSDEFTGTALVGGSPDRSGAISAARWQSGQSVFNFEPEQPNMLTVIADGGQGATLPQVSLTYARRWAGEAV